MFLIQILASQLVCEKIYLNWDRTKGVRLVSELWIWKIATASLEFWLFLTQIQIYRKVTFGPQPRLQKRTKCDGWSGKTRQRRLISSDSVSLIRVLTSLWWNQFLRVGLPNPNPLITGQEPKAEDQKLQELQMLSGPVRMVTHVSI